MTRSIVIGAGMVGLATAWHLQERGVDVTVIDRAGVAAGSSWGNAGWLAPAKTIPLADPSVWTYGPRALFDADAALHVPVRVDVSLWSFLARFVAHGTQHAWDTAMAALTPIDKLALESFDELIDGGVDAWTREGPFIVGFSHEKQARGFMRDIAGVIQHGQRVQVERLDDPRALAPQLSGQVGAAYRMDGQRFIEPGPFVHALAAAVEERGADMRVNAAVTNVNRTSTPTVTLATGEKLTADSVVIATGAWMPELARPLGVSVRVQAGRGYSFTVDTDEPAAHPIYLPLQRVACTPYDGRLRIAGTMEFVGPDEPLQARRVQAIVNQVRPFMTGVDLDNRHDEWVGSRPVTPDGLPLVGETRSAGVYVAGGHGMWGIVLGPATGKLLAERIVTGRTDPAMAPFDPLR
ncbi:NAD(P)/FAD-dependent oxidoreductase [Paramicrobacterium agarici]|uniref:NAD(P)/FAD-dependent oxidoreductase n=1 Tax=Paramicrobacterium agarici TaxID=630514 RepID=UPI0011516D2E|nr:FAD-dependent oxidoreductase [Microbacterium agarici]TQO22315.1 D-amino acid dehydrogenase small subunit [Microbacterium agarici]